MTNLHIPQPKRISIAPAGRGWKPRPEILVNADYVHSLLEENRITERDESLMRYLDQVNVLSARQIKRLLWPDKSLSRMQRRLRELYNYYILDRTRMLNKREGITYALGKAGIIWLHGEARGRSGPLVNARLLAHELMIAEVMVLLVEELRRADPKRALGVEFDWRNEDAARVLSRKGAVLLEPDAFFRVRSQHIQWAAFYLEVDRSTERGNAFDKKVRRYHDAFQSSSWKGEFEEYPVILIVTRSEERAVNLARRVVEAQKHSRWRSLTWGITPLPALIQKGVFGADWLVAQGNELLGWQRFEIEFK